MSEDHDQQKTEAPTPRRRERAREEGDVLYSHDLTSGLTLLVITGTAFLFGSAFLENFCWEFSKAFTHLHSASWGRAETIAASQWLLSQCCSTGGIIALTTMGLAIFWTHLQSGLTVTFRPISPKWDKLSPAKGWTRLMSIESVVRSCLSCLKLTTSVVLILWICNAQKDKLNSLGLMPLKALFGLGAQILLQIALGLAALMLIWGVIDYLFRWYRYEQKLRMSKQEIKDETKEDQGDPQIRMRIRRAHLESRQRKALNDVPQATMVITNPTHFAVALKYDAGRMRAPVVVAKGTDAFARRIARVARENGVPVFERKPLTRAIYALADLGDEIPTEFYRAIAELLAQVYRLKNSA